VLVPTTAILYDGSMSELVLARRDGPVLVLTLNDPERANPLSAPLADRLYRDLAAAAEDRTLRAIVLTGAGRHFSAGADLAALERLAEGGTEADNREDSERLERLYAELLDHPKLTVAAVHGAAIGGGCGLATACDLVIAERGARFGYTEITIGFIPALVSTFLTRRVAGHVARRLLLDPGLVDGARAVELGIADELVEDGTAVATAIERAGSIARRSSAAALAATKRLLNLSVGMGWRDALMAASRANVQQRRHPDCRRGVRTFLATKSTPDWLAEADAPSKPPTGDEDPGSGE
jgi:methylglutaconyl-CoA hydratase